MSAALVLGTITFPGITAPKSMVGTRLLGTQPSNYVIYARPQPGSPDVSGTATCVFGSSTNLLTMRNTLCDKGVLQITEHGQIQVFSILDKRWAWHKGVVTGAYNVRDSAGNIIAATQKTLAELVTILLTAVGESSADVSLISTTEKPAVTWSQDQVDDELDALLIPRGYVVALLANDTVKIYPKGIGAILPLNDDLVNVTVSIDPPALPLTLRAAGLRTMVQSMLKCKPVGWDTDGTIKEAKDLSYNPGGVGNASGWDGQDLITMAFITDPLARQRGLLSVGRWYQIDSQADGTQNLNFGGVNYVPGEISVSSGDQLLPVKRFLLTSGTNIFSQTKYDEAFVSGTFWDGAATNGPANVGPFYQLTQTPWSLIEEYGIVAFEQDAPETKDDAGVKKFADVYLTCSYAIHPTTTYVKDRYTRDRNLGGIGTDVVDVDYLQRELIAGYATGTSTINALSDNKTAQDTLADVVLDNAQRQYATVAGTLLVYRDIQVFNTDGINLQMRWHVAIGEKTPFSTVCSQNAELLPLLPQASDYAKARTIRRNGSPTNRKNRQYNWSMFGSSAPGGGIP